MTLANMVAEMGAKTGIATTAGLPGVESPPSISAAAYSKTHTFDVTDLRPQVARPPAPDNVVPVDTVLGTRVQAAFIGSCTNSRLEDLQAAAAVLRGHKIHPEVRLIIAPASRAVFNAALRFFSVSP